MIIEVATRAKEPSTTPITTAVMWEPLVGAVSLPLVVGIGVLVLEPGGLVLEVDMEFGCDVGFGTKVLVGVKGGGGGV